MTLVGAGGVRVARVNRRSSFERDLRKLLKRDRPLALRALDKLDDLVKAPMPPGLRFEKLKGYADPALYTIHVTGNYKISMQITGDTATLRRLAPHDEIDRAP